MDRERMTSSGGMRTVLLALAVLEAVAEIQPAGVAELARTLDEPKSTVQRTLQSLWIAGWIHPDDSPLTRWVLSPRMRYLGDRVPAESNVRQAAIAVMHELRDRTGETINLVVREGNKVVLIETVETRHHVRPVRAIGTLAPLHGSSNGKAILSTMPRDEVRTVVGSLDRYTASTIIDWNTLFADLDFAAQRGYTVNDGEWDTDIAAVAAPISNRAGNAIAALSVSTPRSRMRPESWSTYGALIHDAARQVSAIIGAPE